MVIGKKYLFEWFDISDCTLQISRDNGVTWNTIISNVITDLSEEINPSGYCSYSWDIVGPASIQCYIKFIDNSDSTELIGEQFSIISTANKKGFKFQYKYSF